MMPLRSMSRAWMSATADVPHCLPGFRLSPERRGFRHPGASRGPGIEAGDSRKLVFRGSGRDPLDDAIELLGSELAKVALLAGLLLHQQASLRIPGDDRRAARATGEGA